MKILQLEQYPILLGSLTPELAKVTARKVVDAIVSSNYVFPDVKEVTLLFDFISPLLTNEVDPNMTAYEQDLE